MRFLFPAFIAIPLIEMLLLFEVADEIGGFTTLALVVLTAVIGIQVLKQQGFSTLLRANERIASGQLPAQEIVEGMMLAGAGALLLTPGFLTDGIGFILLTGPLRRPLAQRVVKAGVVHTVGGASSGGFHYQSYRGGTEGEGNVYEGEYSRPDDPKIGKSEPDSEE